MERSAQTGTATQVHFRFSRFSAPYRSRLLQGLCDLQDYCKQELGQDLRVLIRQRRVIDRLLGAYVMDRHASSDGKQLSLVKHALLGCQHLNPRLRGRLAISWENLRVWEEQKVANLRRPLPVPIWVCMVGLSRAHGFTAQDGAVRSQWFIMAILLEIGMLCLLHPGELLKLRHSDFALPGSFSLSQSQAAIRMEAPKNRRQFGQQQFVSLKNSNVIAWIREFLTVGSHDLFWPATKGAFSKCFQQLISELGLKHHRFTPGSLRPGGATMYYGRGMPISSLRFLGRGTVERSLEHYIQQAMAVQILNRLESSIVRRLCKLGGMCIDLAPHVSCRSTMPSLPKLGCRDATILVGWCSGDAEFDC